MRQTASISCLAVAVISLSAGHARADQVVVSEHRDSDDSSNMLLVNPGDLFSGIVSLEYERALSSWFGVTGGLSVVSFRGVFNLPATYSYVAVLPELGARLHFIRDAPGGLWIGPYVSLGYVAWRSGGPVTRAFGYGLGAALGYNFILGRHFVFQVGVGTAINDLGDGFAFVPRLRLGLGAVF